MKGHVGRLTSAIEGASVPWKLARATDQGFFPLPEPEGCRLGLDRSGIHAQPWVQG